MGICVFSTYFYSVRRKLCLRSARVCAIFPCSYFIGLLSGIFFLACPLRKDSPDVVKELHGRSDENEVGWQDIKESGSWVLTGPTASASSATYQHKVISSLMMTSERWEIQRTQAGVCCN